MRTRNKAAKEQTANRVRPKRGTETPEPKTPSKQQQQPGTPGKKKGKEKGETPSKNRKRCQEKMEEEEKEEKDLGLFKKKRERAESPSSVTTDSGSIIDEVDNNEAESENTENSLPMSSSNGSISNSSIAPSANTETVVKAVVKTEPQVETEKSSTTPAQQATSSVTVITTTGKVPEKPTSPLNVSIRLPDDINERKNLIKRNLEHTELKDVKFSSESTTKKPEPSVPLKTEKEPVEESKEYQDKYKTELIIPKVVSIKEENEQQAPLEMTTSANKEDQIYNYHNLHPLNLKDPPKDPQILNYLKEPFKQQQPDSYTPTFNQQSIKLEPRDEPIELTSSSSSREVYGQPLNIPVVPHVQPQQQPQQQLQRPEDDDKRLQEEKRIEKLERPERLDRPERSDLGIATPIGHPPIPSLMQSGL